MAILEKEVWVRTHNQTNNYYRNLGYKIPRSGMFSVKIEDLKDGSNVKVTKICDICGKNLKKHKYGRIISGRNAGDGNDLCKQCGRIKAVKTREKNMNTEDTLEYYCQMNNKIFLLKEFSNKNIKKPNEISYGSKQKLLWDCFDCGSEYTMKAYERTTHNYKCPYCAGSRVNHTNCLWKTHPHVAKLLNDPQSGYEITSGSNKSEKFTCTRCGHVESKQIFNIVKNGFSCSRCSDGISYPEKFIINFLTQLKINFEREKVFNWSKNIQTSKNSLNGDKRFDFFIPSLNYIIETHGRQHYEDGYYFNSNRTLNDEIENDELKEKLAKENGIMNYFVIDCRFSRPEWIKESIKNSKLPKAIKIDSINWDTCHAFACNSLIEKVCELWNDSKSMEEISDILSLSKSTILRYLKQGDVIGWCEIPIKPKKKRVVQLSISEEFIQEWESISIASSSLSLHASNISSVCKKKTKSTGGYKWMYKEDYDQYIKQVK